MVLKPNTSRMTTARQHRSSIPITNIPQVVAVIHKAYWSPWVVAWSGYNPGAEGAPGETAALDWVVDPDKDEEEPGTKEAEVIVTCLWNQFSQASIITLITPITEWYFKGIVKWEFFFS